VPGLNWLALHNYKETEDVLDLVWRMTKFHFWDITDIRNLRPRLMDFHQNSSICITSSCHLRARPSFYKANWSPSDSLLGNAKKSDSGYPWEGDIARFFDFSQQF